MLSPIRLKSSMLLTAPRCTQCSWSSLGTRVLGRMQSTVPAEPSIPPLLSKIKIDLKAAMKARDKTRLDVLRALIAETINAGKTSKPIETDIQLLALLRKRISSGNDAAAQFEAANRGDLHEKEMGQVKVLEEYAAQVATLSEEQVDSIIQHTIGKLRSSEGKLNQGSILKALFEPAGDLTGKPVEQGIVARRVAQLMQA